MNNSLPFTCEEVLDLLAVDWRTYSKGREVFNLACPFCDSGKRANRLNVNLRKQVFRCPKCNNSGGAVHLYHFFRNGVSVIPNKDDYFKELKTIQKALHGNSVEAKRAAEYRAKAAKNAPVSLHSVEVLSDDELDEAYRAILEQPEFKLSEEHRKKLLERGLDEETIRVNQYRTIPPYREARKLVSQEQTDYFKKKGLGKVKEETAGLKYQSNVMLIIGFSIAARLKKRGIKIFGVPGFFMFGEKYPCLNLPASGIMIPTRNMDGKIVGIQVRTDSGSIRYLTISSKNYENGVEERISRAHWVLSSDPVEVYDEEERPQIILTEGPLKADVATYLLRKRGYKGYFAFAAIPGVNTTAMFFEDCEVLKRLGYDKITLALDMDKCTNTNVMRGGKKLRDELTKRGFSVNIMTWDRESADELVEKQKKLIEEMDLRMPEKLPRNVFFEAAALSYVLKDAGVKEDRYQWNPKTKGIDDYLLHAEKLDFAS